MNIQFTTRAKLREADLLLSKKDGESWRAAATVLLLSAAEQNTADSENYAPTLNLALKKLTEDPYECLGVERKADAAAIKKAYRRLALKHHPDKTANRTTVLFAAIQAAYVLLNDDQKRAGFDARHARRAAQSENLKKHKEKAPSNNMRRPPSTNSFHIPASTAEEAKQRDFNKQFFNDYRKTAKSPVKKPPPPPGPAPEGSRVKTPQPKKNAAPPIMEKPTLLRMNSRTDTTVTIEWRGPLLGGIEAKAYELQWRLRSESSKAWESSQQLILRTTCRKRNLRPSSCYEFRVRAASINGWSPHSETLMVVTLARGASKPAAERPASSSASRPTLPKVKVPKVGEVSWICSICKRGNLNAAPKCAVCGTRKDYQSSNKAPKKNTHERRRRPSFDNAPPNIEEEEDEDLDEDVWSFSATDVKDKQPAERDVDWMDEDEKKPAAGKKSSFWLNTAVTSLHNVRAEPIKGAKIVGHLLADTEITVLGQAGDWFKCRCHAKPNAASSTNAYGDDGAKEGWCLSKTGEKNNHVIYIVEDGHAYPGKSPQRASSSSSSSDDDEEEEEEQIYELRDEDQNRYYFNNLTGASMWEPPEWLDEVDPASGAVYYVHSKSGETQWERPFDFVPIVREELYSTPQAAFIKSILSPKRSMNKMPKMP